MSSDRADDLAYQIYLIRIGTGSAALACNTCRSRAAVFDLGWLDGSRPARCICQHCVDEELDVPQFNTARQIGELLEAERTQNSEFLARSAQFFEDWWSDKTAPAFIASFIARHLRQPPWREIAAAGVEQLPPDAVETVEPIAVAAARVALLIMRGALATNGATRPDVYLIAPPGRALAAGDAASVMAAMPKPVSCRAAIRDGHMAVTRAPITDPRHLAFHNAMDEHSAPRDEGDPGYATSAPRSDRVYCLGAGESLIVTEETIDVVWRDYELRPIATNADVPAFYLPNHPDAAPEAHEARVAQMIKCAFGPDDSAREESGYTIAIRNEAWRVEMVIDYAPENAGPCERCGMHPAQWNATDVRTDTWTRQTICVNCAVAFAEPMAHRHVLALDAILDAPRDHNFGHPDPLFRVLQSLHEEPRDERAERLRSAATLVERTWRLLPAPSFVVEALTRYRRSSHAGPSR